MGLKPLLVGALLLTLAEPAATATRAKTRFDGIRDCERAGTLQFMRQNPAFRRLVIDRANVTAEKYAEHVGNRFVSTVYHGKAIYEAALGPRQVRFICLHAGIGRRAVFVYALPD